MMGNCPGADWVLQMAGRATRSPNSAPKSSSRPPQSSLEKAHKNAPLAEFSIFQPLGLGKHTFSLPWSLRSASASEGSFFFFNIIKKVI